MRNAVTVTLAAPLLAGERVAVCVSCPATVYDHEGKELAVLQRGAVGTFLAVYTETEPRELAWALASGLHGSSS